MKKLISYALVFVLCASVITLGATYADEQQQLNEIHSKIDKSKSQLNEGKKKERQLGEQIKKLEGQITATEREIADIKGDINKTEQEIAVVKSNLQAAEQEMEGQNENLKKRLRAMYKNGDVGMVQILFGSESFTDFMSNMDMVQKIYDHDVEVLKVLEEQCEKIELQKKQLEALQAKLLTERQKEMDKQSTLQANRGQVASLKSEVAKSNAQIEAQLDALNAEANRLIDEIRRLQGDGAFIGGKFAWPGESSYVTSEFGMRHHPILKVNKLHTGIDLRAPLGSKVFAANGGTVIKAGWNNSYGNVVMIDHGGQIVTLYAHNSKLLVKAGDVVSIGQTIAQAGSTGNSTGPHIHFEVRVNGQYQDPRNWL